MQAQIPVLQQARGRTTVLDIQNVSNRLNTMGAYYDPDEDMIDTWTQMGIIPTIIYRVEF